ncbi:hypothetical protein BX666DRAFT_1897317 [Dichotomocladium elegans]|nr:hypothetical protein BX666DRAFT_1897317 [Dichotomocladium elegans]
MSIAYKGYPALTGIVLVNTAVFFIWQNRENADVMARHFVHKDQDLSQGYWYTVLTSGFSQEGLLHFGSNMLFLCTLGRHAVPLLGNGGFLAAYACLTVASSLATRAYHTYIYPRHHNHKSGYQSHGASGAVLGLLGFIGVAGKNSYFHS